MPETAVKSRAILFSGPMVRAILAGKKTQTRRVVKWPQGKAGEFLAGYDWAKDCDGKWALTNDGLGFFDAAETFKHPYGSKGDRLWVRETFLLAKPAGADMAKEVPFYRASTEHSDKIKWKPSIFMPRAASRISLEILDVRVQRLQEITEEDCREEGCAGGHDSIPDYPFSATPREHYRSVWTKINGPKSWDSNPWVWAITFKRCEAKA
jgi:hypothetical protein